MALMLLKLLFFSFDISCHFVLDQDRIDSKVFISTFINGNIRHPIKPRIMTQIPIPIDQQTISDDDIQICKLFSKFYD